MIKILVISLFLLSSMTAHAESKNDKHNWQIAKKLVLEATSFAKHHDQLSLFDTINKAQFVTPNSYVFALSTDGTVLAHSYQKDIIGQHTVLEEKYIQRMLDIINQYGQGWIEYHFTDPATGKDMPKLSYIKRVSEVVFVGAGVY
ncbi:MAG: hypothetical protein HFP78_08525 [Methylococcales symbiont of Hymedesmia sp. n. MRB-2018]|nr:MAG: hypothetical protein HFP78_08525 [Methylococcales symbiont of Hymedesmia sp. n. MRB-2018]